MAQFMHKNIRNPHTLFLKMTSNARPLGLKNRIHTFHEQKRVMNTNRAVENTEQKSKLER